VERHVSTFDRNRQPRPYYSAELSDYRIYKDVSGEVIHFPHRAVFRFFAGQLRDGRKAEYATEIIDIQKADFNIEVPDERFVIDFPPDAEIDDRVSGLGFIRGDHPAITPPSTSFPKWLRWAAINLLGLLLLGGYLAFRKLRRKGAERI
jgi:hypothetical protein